MVLGPSIVDCKVAKLISLEPNAGHLPEPVKQAEQLDDLIADILSDMEADAQFKVPDRKRKPRRTLKNARKMTTN